MEDDSLFPDQFFIEIKAILQKARQHAYKAINTVMIEAYWRIGQRIVEREQLGDARASYGDELIQKLSQSLQEEFGKGFSYANLKNFRQFYLNYSEEEISYALRSQLTWTHHRSIMRVESKEARMYYLKEANEQGWSTRTLDRNINTFYYQRVLSSREKDKEGHDKPASQGFISQGFIKDPYVFEFLDIPEPKSFSEKNIEQGLISSLQEFLLELGKGFSFVGRQYRISTETEHYYIDLVFYNYLLKCCYCSGGIRQSGVAPA